MCTLCLSFLTDTQHFSDLTSLQSAILKSLRTANDLEPSSYKAWHAWAIMNYRLIEVDPSYVVAAVRGFFRNVSLGQDQVCNC
jgi:FAT domain